MLEKVNVIILKDKRCIKGRKSNPYILVDIFENNNKILLELPKNYVKLNNNIEEFYFIWEELNNNEKNFFQELYCTIEVLFVYQFSKYKENIKKKENNSLKKILRKPKLKKI